MRKLQMGMVQRSCGCKDSSLASDLSTIQTSVQPRQSPRSVMRILSLIVLMLVPVLGSVQNRNGAQPLKVKIEATELDRKMLVEKLNSHGESHHLKFQLVEQDFDYRITFGTGQGTVNTVYGAVNSSAATTSVFDANGKELFEFRREGRWTDSGATNAAAKEIIKRLLRLGPASK
jgi:hypothetical protein